MAPSSSVAGMPQDAETYVGAGGALVGMIEYAAGCSEDGLNASSLENVCASKSLRKSAQPCSAEKKVHGDLMESLQDDAGRSDHSLARLHTHRNGADALIDEVDRASSLLPHQAPHRRGLLHPPRQHHLRDNREYASLVLNLAPSYEGLIQRRKGVYFYAHLADGSGIPSSMSVAEMSLPHPFLHHRTLRFPDSKHQGGCQQTQLFLLVDILAMHAFDD
jgi:hypothetical protein